MAFDFTLAIANMDAAALDAPSADLRARYPELGSVFDQLDALVDDREAYGDPAELSQKVDDLQQTLCNAEAVVDEAEARFAQLRDMALTIGQFDVENRTDDLLQTLAGKADDAQVWIRERWDA